MKLICNVLFQMVYGIGLEFAALPGAWWLHAILLVIMMITLAYLEVGEAIMLFCVRAGRPPSPTLACNRDSKWP